MNTVNEITDITGGSWIEPTYDAAGNMIAMAQPESETDRLFAVYDAWNRLVKVYADDGDGTFEPGTDDDLLVTYEYDGLNRRIEKGVTADGGGARDVDYFYNESWQLLESQDDDGSDVAIDQTVWDVSYVDAPVVRYHDANGDGDYLDTGDTIQYYTWDANQNITAAIEEDGTIVERYVYTPYGSPTVYDASWANGAAPTEDGPLFAGYHYDTETGLYHVRNRQYHPTLGNFTTRDPIGYAAGDVNLYRYVGNDSLRATDPSGLVDVRKLFGQWGKARSEFEREMRYFSICDQTRKDRFTPGAYIQSMDYYAAEKARVGAMKRAVQHYKRAQALEGKVLPLLQDALFEATKQIAEEYKNGVVARMPRFYVACIDDDGDGSAKTLPLDIDPQVLKTRHLDNPKHRVFAQSIGNHAWFVEIDTADEFYLGTDEEIISAVLIRMRNVLYDRMNLTEKVAAGMDDIQSALDMLGTIPVVGNAFDVTNAVISFGRGDAGNVILSTAAAAPVVGQAVGSAKITARFIKIIDRFANIIDAIGGHTKLSKGIISSVRYGDEAAIATSLKRLEANTTVWSRTPKSTMDQMVLEGAKLGRGIRVKENLGDPQFKGMEKWSYSVRSDAGILSEVHYVKNPYTGELMDFKFKHHADLYK